MAKGIWLSLSLAVLMAGSAAAQDARSVLQAAATAMGVSNVKSIQYSGTGWQGMVGQNFAPDQDWPRVDLTSYTRTIDFDIDVLEERNTSGCKATIRRAAAAPGFRS